MLAVFGGAAEFERDMIRERQREGIAIAKAKGEHLGRAAILKLHRSGNYASALRLARVRRKLQRRSASVGRAFTTTQTHREAEDAISPAQERVVLSTPLATE